MSMDIKRRIFVTISQVANVMTGGLPDELLCSRMWRKKQAGHKVGIVMVKILDTIFFFDKDHCKDSYEAEINREHLPDAIKNAQHLG
jgi:hypothetical protein